MNERILIVDDEPANLRLLERMLNAAGYHDLVTTTDARTVLDLYRDRRPDLVVLDLMMPHLDGMAILGRLRAEFPESAYTPVLVLTADATVEAKRKALAAGARDFLTKPFEHFEALLRIRNLLDMRALYRTLESQNQTLEETVRQRTAQLFQSEKIAAMGALLAGVAHELNNPLAVLSGHAQLLVEEAIPGVGARAGQIHAAADRCVRIVRNFLALARQRPSERGRTIVRDLINGSVELLAYELRTDGITVEVDVANDVPLLWADAHQLHQVLVNLITNAHHAMRRQPGSRRITLTARRDAAAGSARLAIADTGPGIPPEVRTRIFEPFFTTKPVGEGTGLGLSLCHSIIAEHRGTITVESEEGRGATFVITLPVGTPPATVAGPDVPAVAPVRPGRILVVDDEVEIGTVIADALRRDGHTTEVTPDARAALALLDEHAYDVIVSDTRMPEMDGQTFYEEVTRRFPALRRQIVFVTGDVLSPDKLRFLEQIGAPFLAKPCDLGELRRIVAGLSAQNGRR